jgi:hypothetical protein
VVELPLGPGTGPGNLLLVPEPISLRRGVAICLVYPRPRPLFSVASVTSHCNRASSEQMLTVTGSSGNGDTVALASRLGPGALSCHGHGDRDTCGMFAMSSFTVIARMSRLCHRRRRRAGRPGPAAAVTDSDPPESWRRPGRLK